MNHAWNQVKLNGQWYHIDVTWDDPTMANNTSLTSTEDIYGNCRHTFFLLSDNGIKAERHYGWDTSAEVCTSTKYETLGIQKIKSRAYRVDGNWYYLYDSGEYYYLTSYLYRTNDIFGGDYTSHILDINSNGYDYCLGYYNNRFYFTDYFNETVYSIKKDGTDYRNVDSVLGCTSPVRELKIDPDGLVTYVYTGSSDEHTHQLTQPPKPLSATLQAKYTTVSRNGVIKLTAVAAAGSKSGYTYRFSIKNNTTGKSAYLTDFQKSGNYWWNTGSVGSKTITVEVKDSTGSVGRKSLNINVVNFTAKISAQKTTIASGVTNKITASTQTGIGNKTYRFRIKDAKTGKTVTLRDYQKSSEYIWKAGSTGTKTIYVDVKDECGAVATASVNITVVPITVNLQAQKTTIAPQTTNILTAAVAGGNQKNYKYTFRIKNNNTGKTATLSSNQTSNTFKWNSGSAGSKTLFVDVTDGTGTKATASVTINVQKSNLAVSLSAASRTPKSGTADRLTASVSGSSGKCTYTFRIKDNKTGKIAVLSSKQTTNVFQWTAGATGSKTLFVDVTDATGTTATASVMISVK